jgi:phage terminase small subunit
MSFKRNIVNYIKQLLKESLNCYCEQFNQYYQQKLKNKGKWKIKKTQQISFK